MRTIQFSIRTSIAALLLTVGAGCTYDTIVDQPYAGPIDGLDLFTGNIETPSTTPINITWKADDKVGIFAGEVANKVYTLRENMNSSAVFAPEDDTAIEGIFDRIYAYTPYNADATSPMLPLSTPPRMESYCYCGVVSVQMESMPLVEPSLIQGIYAAPGISRATHSMMTEDTPCYFAIFRALSYSPTTQTSPRCKLFCDRCASNRRISSS